MEAGNFRADRMDTVTYQLDFPDGRRWALPIQLSEAPPAMPDHAPDWTKLTFQQCTNCTLDDGTHHYCPLAVSLAEPVRAFAGIPSWTPVVVQVSTGTRVVNCETTLQRTAGSMLGLLSALSGCPHTRALLPMAMFHLPFATPEETLFRVLGTYLTGQHLREQEGLPGDWQLTGLFEIYRKLKVVNGGLANRIRVAAESESSVNAIVLLDILVSDMALLIEEREAELRGMFGAYLQAPAAP